MVQSTSAIARVWLPGDAQHLGVAAATQHCKKRIGSLGYIITEWNLPRGTHHLGAASIPMPAPFKLKPQRVCFTKQLVSQNPNPSVIDCIEFRVPST